MITKKCKKCGCFIGKKEHKCEDIWKKVKENHCDQRGINNHMFGKKQSSESNLKRSLKLRKIRKGRLNPFFGKHHSENGELIKKDIQRQKEIKKELNCSFIRIKDY